MKKIPLLLIIVLLCQCTFQKNDIARNNNKISEITLAFGSCNKEYEEQVLWDDILKEKPKAWIWLGDNIYGDSSDPEVMKNKYDQQKSNPEYQQLRKESLIYGTWDDHDYGKNDAGKEFAERALMRDLMLDFLDVPKTNEVWNREGTYQSYIINEDKLSIRLILLDSRYFRDEPTREGRNYLPNLDGTILGESQWKWLEEEMSSANEDIILLGNGIQMLSSEHKYEKWANFPHERERLIDLIDKTKQQVIILSGDRHFTELSKLHGVKPIYEFTCSGMTHTYSGDTPDINSLRVSKFIAEKNYGILKITKSNNSISIRAQARGDEGKMLFEKKI